MWHSETHYPKANYCTICNHKLADSIHLHSKLSKIISCDYFQMVNQWEAPFCMIFRKVKVDYLNLGLNL